MTFTRRSLIRHATRRGPLERARLPVAADDMDGAAEPESNCFFVFHADWLCAVRIVNPDPAALDSMEIF